jgi:hypothetical protein
VEGFAALTIYLVPLSLALSRGGRGKILFITSDSIQIGYAHKLDVYTGA